jgi:hypothetical protein
MAPTAQTAMARQVGQAGHETGVPAEVERVELVQRDLDAVARHQVVAVGLQPLDVARGQLDRVPLGGEAARDGPRHAGGRAEDQDGFLHSPSLSD